MSTRDRNVRGRAENARPRDGLGRPLPRGSAGVERVNEDVVMTPAESLREGQRLLTAQRPFHAHEVLEAAWKNAPDPERGLWKALAQLAVGLTHVRRGNAKGAASLLRRCSDGMAPHTADPPHGIRAAELSDHAAELATRIERAGLDAVDEAELDPQLSEGSRPPAEQRTADG
ncbi:DUF309 domain-containing protein [Salinifilum aidingensis]